MNKFFISIFILCLIFNNANAEIYKSKDKFNEDIIIINNSINITGFDYVRFGKIIEKNGKVSYNLYFVKETYGRYAKWWFFSNKQTPEIKIETLNETTIYNLDYFHTDSQIKSGFPKPSNYLKTSLLIVIPPKIINILAGNIKQVTIRIYFSQYPSVIWQVPDKILKEWKQIIEMKGE